jgi:O-6-methylguanine DNA methyltransferase
MNETTMIEELAALASTAPPSLLPAVLGEAGIADRYVRRPSVLGELFVAFTAEGVSSVDLAEDAAQFEEQYAARFGRPVLPVEQAPAKVERHLDRAISDGRPGPLPVDLSSVTEFQADVLRTTARIPRGEVRPYAWVAKEIGRSGATRAVGSALASNPVPLIIPCHRVVRSDGKLGRYSLGVDDNKRALLESEGLDTGELREMANRGVRFTGSDTTKIFCNPTCRHARRTMPKHQVEFTSENEATNAGYRPCKVCKPVAA